MPNDNDIYEGIVVCDLTQGIAGPHSTMLLAQHGATVIKVEPPEGDWGRVLGTKYGDLSAHSLVFNRGKQSIALDLKTPQGKDILRKLIARADIVAESFRPGVIGKLGFGYEAVREQRPDIVYMSISGYGQQGPRSQLPGTDSVIQAVTGLMNINRGSDGTPRRITFSAVDIMTGLYGYQAMATALFNQKMRGRGAYLDINLMQCAAAFQAASILECHLDGGLKETLYVPLATVRTADGYLQISAMRDKNFASLCRVLGVPEIPQDERFRTHDGRVANEQPLMAILRERFLTQPTAHWASQLTEADVMNCPVGDYESYLQDAHVRETGAVAWIEHEGTGRTPVVQLPGVRRPEPGSTRWHAPNVGEHSEQVLQELGYTAHDIEQLLAQDVVHASKVAA